MARVSKKSANVYYIFKKYVHQTFKDKSELLLATSFCLSLVSVMKLALSKYIYKKRNALKDLKILRHIASANHAHHTHLLIRHKYRNVIPAVFNPALVMPRDCVNSADNFCYISGEVTFARQ